jgi:hypothetical protein
LRQKVWKNSEKVWKKDQKMFGKSSENVRKFRKFRKSGISELSENYEKMTFNSKFENHEKLVPTRKFGKKFGMQGLIYYIQAVLVIRGLFIYSFGNSRSRKEFFEEPNIQI